MTCKVCGNRAAGVTEDGSFCLECFYKQSSISIGFSGGSGKKPEEKPQTSAFVADSADSPKPSKENEHDFQPFIDKLKKDLEEYAEDLKLHIGFMGRKEMVELMKIVEEQAAKLPRNNGITAVRDAGWKSFMREWSSNDLKDDQNYLVRRISKDGKKSAQHMAYWDSEEQAFFLLHCTSGLPPMVDEYLEIPE